jgi:C-terminal processing protease CtpA/Prc
MRNRSFSLAGVVCLCAGVVVRAQAPLLNSTERTRARDMLAEIKTAIRNDYYDKTFHGLDLDNHFKTAQAKIDTAVSLGHAYAIIAQALIDLNDSHTFFIPPSRTAKYDYGWRMSVVGDECYVTAVKPGSDAEAKGLKPGDRVVRLEAFLPVRDQLWKAQYLYHVLSPRASIKVAVQGPIDTQPRVVEIASKVTPGPKDQRVSLDSLFEGGRISFGDAPSTQHVSRVQHVGDVAVWKLAAFDFPPDSVDQLFDGVVKGARALVLDLRGNPGGMVKTLEAMTGRLFDRDVKIADVQGRKGSKPSMAKKSKSPFAGKIAVLIDSDSASAAELFARVVQLEKRGAIVGDRSSGSVMESQFHGFMLRVPDASSDLTVIPYGVSVTAADMIMTDGKSLEHAGVTPDEVVLPTADDFRTGRDPALARAIALVGGTITPAAAGALFPVEWK